MPVTVDIPGARRQGLQARPLVTSDGKGFRVEPSGAKVRDRGEAGAAEKIRFSSSILTKLAARRTKSSRWAAAGVFILRWASMGDFQEALAALLGKDARCAGGDRAADGGVAGRLRRLSGTQASCFPMWISRSVFPRTIRCGVTSSPKTPIAPVVSHPRTAPRPQLASSSESRYLAFSCTTIRVLPGDRGPMLSRHQKSTMRPSKTHAREKRRVSGLPAPARGQGKCQSKESSGVNIARSPCGPGT